MKFLKCARCQSRTRLSETIAIKAQNFNFCPSCAVIVRKSSALSSDGYKRDKTAADEAARRRKEARRAARDASQPMFDMDAYYVHKDIDHA